MEEQMDGNENVLENIHNVIIQYNSQRLMLEQEEKYVEAGAIKAEIERLGEQYKTFTIQMLRQQQQQEKDQIEFQYQKELEQKQQFWQNKMEENGKEMESMLQAMQMKQQEEIEKKQNEFVANLQYQGKPTPEMLKCEISMKTLAKN